MYSTSVKKGEKGANKQTGFKGESYRLGFIIDKILSTSEKGDLSEETNSRTGVLQPCLVCIDRNNSREIFKHSMATCAI